MTTRPLTYTNHAENEENWRQNGKKTHKKYNTENKPHKKYAEKIEEYSLPYGQR